MNLVEAFRRVMSLQRSSHAFTANELATLMAVINEFNTQGWPSEIYGSATKLAQSIGFRQVAATSSDKFRQFKLLSSCGPPTIVLGAELSNGAGSDMSKQQQTTPTVCYPTSAPTNMSGDALTENDLRSTYGDELVETAIGIAKKRHKPLKPAYLGGILKRLAKENDKNVLSEQPKGNDSSHEQGHDGQRNLGKDLDEKVQSSRHYESNSGGDGGQADESLDDLLPSAAEIARYLK